VLLGCEQVEGPRWSQVRLRGGELAPSVIREDLPRWGGVSFLAADNAGPLDPGALRQIIAAGSATAPVVLDLPRWDCAERRVALTLCDLVVLVTPAEVPSAALIAAHLDPARTVVAVRGSSRAISADRICSVLALPIIGELPYDPAGSRPEGLAISRVRRGTRLVATAVIEAAYRRPVAA
jgi:hypothetical protein